MTLSKMSLDDNFGVASSHFFKSGNIPQCDISQQLKDIVSQIPKNGPYQTNVEYDVWYDMRDYPKVHGYTYTDVLSTFIMLRCASARHSSELIDHVIQNTEINDRGIKIYNHLLEHNVDKYSLRKIRRKFDDTNLDAVVFLPGNNIYDDIVDLDKVDKFVEENNAMIKFHPLTPEVLETKVTKRYGRDRVISSKFSGHEVMEKAKVVAVGKNSEMGLISALKGKSVFLFDKEVEDRVYTYTHLYDNIIVKEFGHYGENDTYETRLKKLFSSKASGMLSKFSDIAVEINEYFEYYMDYPHVATTKVQMESLVND